MIKNKSFLLLKRCRLVNTYCALSKANFSENRFSSLSFQKSNKRETGSCKFLLGGLVSFFGFKKDQPNEEENLETTMKMAVLAIQEGKYDRADKLFHIALKLANEMQHKAAVTHIYCLMANLALERGLLGQAERLFTTVIKRLVADGEKQDSNAVVEISLKLARIFVAYGDKLKAEQGLDFCTDSMRKKVEAFGEEADEDTLALYGMCLDLKAQFLMDKKNFVEAENLFREAIKVATLIHGSKGEQVLVVSNSLATVLSMQDKNAEAARLLTEVVEIAKEIGSMHLASFMINLGVILMKQGLYQMANESCEKAKVLADEIKDEEVKTEAIQCLQEVKSIAQMKRL